MAAVRANRLRPGVVLRAGADGKVVLDDAGSGAAHGVPAEAMEAVSEAIAHGGVPAGAPEGLGDWLEARHLLESERSRAVEAWGAALAPRRGPAETHAGTRFSCHGCGLCCESYIVGPVTPDERARILERADDLAPFVKTPREGWFQDFAPSAHPESKGEGTSFEASSYSLGRLPSGRCVFLAADGLCEVHRRIGADRKPFVCRKFPLHVTRRPDGIIVTIKPECGSLARSREDGMPLEDQAAWVAEIAAGPRPAEVARLVRVAGDLYVPYRMTRAVERRAVGFLTAAPRVEAALLAVRDLLLATLGALPAPPDVASLEREEALVREAPLEVLRAHRPGPARAAPAQRALRTVLELLVRAAEEVLVTDGVLTGDAARAIHATSLESFRRLRSLLEGGAAPGPRHDPETARVAAVEDGTEDAAVQDLARATLSEMIASGRPSSAAPGLIYGYAHLALWFELAAWTSRVVALARGATRAGTQDWGRAIVCVERTLRLIDLAQAAPAVLPCLDLPAMRVD